MSQQLVSERSRGRGVTCTCAWRWLGLQDSGNCVGVHRNSLQGCAAGRCGIPSGRQDTSTACASVEQVGGHGQNLKLLDSRPYLSAARSRCQARV